jgi:carbon monoxide dehydrogenase subunit G
MHMTGEQRIAAPRQRVWEALNDPETLRASIPGCQTLDKEGDARFIATVEVKIGPIGARFKGDVSLVDLEPGLGYTIVGQGNGGIAGSARGNARVRLSDDGAGTLISYVVEAEVGGRMAQLGGPIIDATAKNLAGKFFSRFGEIVGGAIEGGIPAPSVAPAAAAATAAPPRAAAPAPVAARPGFPIAWVLALVCGVLAGVLIGGTSSLAHDVAAQGWQGLAIGLLVIVVAGAAFEYGRRAAAPHVVLDSALLRQLLDGARE